MKLKLIDRKPVVPNVETFVFEPPEPITWQSGQFLHYTLEHPNPDDRKIKRWFTISNPPYKEHPSITTRFTDSGGSSFKKALRSMKLGDEIEATEPEGDFVLEDPSRQYIFIAGGIGITPFHSILLQLDNDKKPINVDLMYANRDNQFPFDDEFQTIASRNPDFRIHKFVGPKHIEAKDIKAVANNLNGPEYYVSGPEPMVEAFDKMLKDMGINKAKIQSDYFPGYKSE